MHLIVNFITQEKMLKQQTTSELARVIESQQLGRIVEQGMKGSFKIPVAELSKLPGELVKSLKVFKSSSSTFRGKNGKRVSYQFKWFLMINLFLQVIFLMDSEMTQTTAKRLKLIAGLKYSLWIKERQIQEIIQEKEYAHFLYSRTENRRYWVT